MRLFSITITIIAIIAAPITVTAEEWLPKNGPYGAPGKDHAERCLDFGDFTLDLARKSSNGPDDMCKILSMSREAPGRIRLTMSCTGVERETPQREFAIIERIDADRIYYRETQEAVWKRPRSEVLFCGEKTRKVYEEMKKEEDAHQSHKKGDE